VVLFFLDCTIEYNLLCIYVKFGVCFCIELVGTFTCA